MLKLPSFSTERVMTCRPLASCTSASRSATRHLCQWPVVGSAIGPAGAAPSKASLISAASVREERCADTIYVPASRTSTVYFTHSPDRKSTRLNSSHLGISYAVFCLKKKKRHRTRHDVSRTRLRPETRKSAQLSC